MKKLYIIILTLLSASSFSQQRSKMETFNSIKNEIGGKIEIIKSSNYEIEKVGDSNKISTIKLSVSDKVLKITSTQSDIDYKNVLIKVYTPTLSSISVSGGGNISIDKRFSEIEDFTATIENGGKVDFSNIKFQNLSVNISSGGLFMYESADHLISNITGGGNIKSAKD